MSQLIINALISEANAKESKAIANLQNYMSNPVGVGEHPDIVEECRKLVQVISDARDFKETCQSLMTKPEGEK